MFLLGKSSNNNKTWWKVKCGDSYLAKHFYCSILRASPKFHIHEAVRAIDQLDKNRGSVSIFKANDMTKLAA